MSVASSLAIAVAERVERSGGARAGLVAWRTLASNATGGEVRGRALLGALRCALALRDEAAFEELTEAWRSVDRGLWDGEVAGLCKDMARAGLLARATALAEVEARRHRTALSLYTFARCLELEARPSAADVFREAAARAEREGATRIEIASRVRRAALLARSLLTLPEAIEEARRVDLAQVPAPSKLAVARVLLRSPSRFVRAGAIGLLDELVLGDDAALASRALAVAARWADCARRGSLTPLESDRLIALFGRERAMAAAPRAKAAMTALDQVLRADDGPTLAAALARAARVQPELAPLHARARDVLRGRFEAAREIDARAPEDLAERRAYRHGQILDVLVALRDGSAPRAARALRLLAAAEEDGEHLPREALAVAHAALTPHVGGASGARGIDPELREWATRLVAARLRRASPGAPPRGFAALADTLASIDEEELATLARRAALLAGEPGAAESLGTALARSGWELARMGSARRAEAIAKLREAKALLAKP